MFGTYLKRCRERFGLSQNDLAAHLYAFDTRFAGVDAVTISRWEREVTTPSLERIRYVIEALQEFDDTLFPCFDALDFSTLEDTIMRRDIRSVIGRYRLLILNFPQEIFDEKGLGFTHLGTLDDPLPALRISHTFMRNVAGASHTFSFERFAKLAQYPSSRFYIATYFKQFFGMIFALRLKPEAFEALMHGRCKTAEITCSMLANEEEEGYIFIVSFFAYHHRAAALVALRFYRYLYVASSHLLGVGALPVRREGAVLATRLGLDRFKELSPSHASYRANMPDVLLNRYMLTMLFKKPSLRKRR